MLTVPSSHELTSAWEHAQHIPEMKSLRHLWQSACLVFREKYHAADALHRVARRHLPPEMFTVSELEGLPHNGVFTIAFLGLAGQHSKVPTTLRIARHTESRGTAQVFHIQGTTKWGHDMDEPVTFHEASERLRLLAREAVPS